MGIATGGGLFPHFKILVGCPPGIMFFFNLTFTKIFGISNITKIKWAKSEEKLEFGGKWF